MEIHLKINDVRGQDERGRHILWINDEDLRQWLDEHQQYVIQTIIQPMLKHHPAILSQIIDDPQVRNVIFMQEQAKRTEKAERRERHRQFEIEKRRREEQHKASIATRKALDFYHDILGIEE